MYYQINTRIQAFWKIPFSGVLAFIILTVSLVLTITVLWICYPWWMISMDLLGSGFVDNATAGAAVMHDLCNHSNGGALNFDCGASTYVYLLTTVSPIILFAMLVSSFCLILSAAVLIVSLPIYFFSGNDDRAKKAGQLTKTSLGFIFSVGTAVLATLNFEMK